MSQVMADIEQRDWRLHFRNGSHHSLFAERLTIGRRELLAALGGAAAVWPLGARAAAWDAGHRVSQWSISIDHKQTDRFVRSRFERDGRTSPAELSRSGRAWRKATML